MFSKQVLSRRSVPATDSVQLELGGGSSASSRMLMSASIFSCFFMFFCFNLSSGGPYLDVGCRKLLISGMSPSTTEQDLRDYFDPFCKVMEAVIIPGIFVSGQM